jgi:hypothetical protein
MVDRLSRRQFIALGTGAVVSGAASGSGDQPPETATVPGGRVVRTIGVLGGLGPQATMVFEVRVHHVAQHLIPPNRNGGYPPMVVYYCRHAPFLLTDKGTPQLPLRPDPRLLEAAKRLGGLADFLVITTNGPHLLQAEIEQAAGRKVLSMVEATLEEVRRQWKRVGVLGLDDPVIYTEPLGWLGIACGCRSPVLGPTPQRYEKSHKTHQRTSNLQFLLRGARSLTNRASAHSDASTPAFSLVSGVESP